MGGRTVDPITDNLAYSIQGIGNESCVPVRRLKRLDSRSMDCIPEKAVAVAARIKCISNHLPQVVDGIDRGIDGTLADIAEPVDFVPDESRTPRYSSYDLTIIIDTGTTRISCYRSEVKVAVDRIPDKWLLISRLIREIANNFRMAVDGICKTRIVALGGADIGLRSKLVPETGV